MIYNEDMDLSIITPLYRGQKFYVKILDMIERNCLYCNFSQKQRIELIFVNDYPNEEIKAEKQNRIFNVRIIEHQRNMGIQASRIDGILNSRGKYIVMLDQDDLIADNYLYSQWHKITSINANYCVCNGWNGRFRILWKESDIRSKINNLEYYLKEGNAICSPGQVIIRKESLPKEWLENIQKFNGADDFFLWIIILKKGEVLAANNEYLYYHTPERSDASIDSLGMLQSLEETLQIVEDKKILTVDENNLLQDQIENRKETLKIKNMTRIMLDWMKIKNKGLGIYSFLERYNYFDIAIYGMGYIGECLYGELCEKGINVKYGIDQLAIDYKQKLPIFRIEDKLEKVDVIIVTIAEEAKKVVKALQAKVSCPVITISEIIFILNNQK